MPDSKVKNRLRETRLRLGLTIVELAKKSGVDPSAISRIERGLRKPKAETLRKLADALGVPLDWLYPSQKEGEG